MPMYSYHCTKCNEVYENMRSIAQRDVKLQCPACNDLCERILDLSSFQLKGDGWYKDGYSKPAPKPKEEKKE
jgi:putative FmdB family regulatory protein